MTEIIGNVCSVDQRSGMIFLKNPLGLKDPYDSLSKTVYLNEIYSTNFFKYIFSSFDVNINDVKSKLNNNFGNGHIYNLQESVVIIGNNITIELSSVALEMKKINKLLSGEQKMNGSSVVDLCSCEKILKKRYGLPDEEDLMILKGELLQLLLGDYLGTQVEYQIFSTSLGAFLPLDECKNAGATATISNILNTTLFEGSMLFKTTSATKEKYNPFDPNSPFYTDICTPFTNENGNDVLLPERRADYFKNNVNLCETGCDFIGYNETINMITCNCPIKNVGEELSYRETNIEVPEDFYKKSEYSNIKVFKCFSQVFSSKNLKVNFGSYTLILLFASFIGVVCMYYVKGKKPNEEDINKLVNSLSEKTTKVDIPDQKNNEEKDDNDDKSNEKSNQKNNTVVDLVLNDTELNSADYDTARANDHKNYGKSYWSLLKVKQLCIFTFYTNTDHSSRWVKIALFILFLSFCLSFTALFFNDNIMRNNL